MAPRLEPSRIQLICDMLSGSGKISYIAGTAKRSRQTVYYIRSNLEHFDSAKAPPICAGRRRLITSSMLEALCDRLLEKPTLYLDEVAVFCGMNLTYMSVLAVLERLSLRSVGQKRQSARGQRNKIRICKTSMFTIFLSSIQISWFLSMSLDAISGRVSEELGGLSPLDIAPVQPSKFHCDRHYQILPAYA